MRVVLLCPLCYSVVSQPINKHSESLFSRLGRCFSTADAEASDVDKMTDRAGDIRMGDT